MAFIILYHLFLNFKRINGFPFYILLLLLSCKIFFTLVLNCSLSLFITGHHYLIRQSLKDNFISYIIIIIKSSKSPPFELDFVCINFFLKFLCQFHTSAFQSKLFALVIDKIFSLSSSSSSSFIIKIFFFMHDTCPLDKPVGQSSHTHTHTCSSLPIHHLHPSFFSSSS